MTPMQKEYQRLKELGAAGSSAEPTWDREKRVHTCCGSKTKWRHLLSCPRVTGDGKLPPDTAQALESLSTFRTAAREHGFNA